MGISNIQLKNQPFAGKVTMTLFWGAQGPTLEHCRERHRVISVCYSEMLRDQLKPAIRTKRRGLLSKSVAMLHDNACPLTVARTVDGLCQLNFVLKHSPHSPDLAPSLTCLAH
jgi:hypothetical protein